jgi:hypothetical protein
MSTLRMKKLISTAGTRPLNGRKRATGYEGISPKIELRELVLISRWVTDDAPDSGRRIEPQET